MIERRQSGFVTTNGLVPVDTICSAIGKGKTTQLLQLALDEYLTQFNSGHLVYHKNNMEKERAMSWIIDIWDARIAIANEFEMATDESKDNYGKRQTRIKKCIASTFDAKM